MMDPGAEKRAQQDLEQAMKITKQAWENTDMPMVSSSCYPAEIGKIAFAILVCKVLDIYGNHSR